MSQIRTLTQDEYEKIKEIVNETVKEELSRNPHAVSRIISKNCKLCFVIGGSFAEREMLNRSDFDACFLIVDDPEHPYSIAYGEKKPFRETLEGIVSEINTGLGLNIELCKGMGSLQTFSSFVNSEELILDGSKIISYADCLDISLPNFLRSNEFNNVRKLFKEKWTEKGIDISEKYKDIDKNLDQMIDALTSDERLRRVGGRKKLYRTIQLLVNQISIAFETYEHSVKVALKQKFERRIKRMQLRQVGEQIFETIDVLRTESPKYAKTPKPLSGQQRKQLGKNLEIIKDFVYAPFRKYKSLMTQMLILLSELGAKVSYFNVAKSHFYIRFDSQQNNLIPLKGIDVDFSLISGSVCILGWVSPFKKFEPLLQKNNLKTVYESSGELGERSHEWTGSRKNQRRHILCGKLKLLDPKQMTIEERNAFKEILLQSSQALRVKNGTRCGL